MRWSSRVSLLMLLCLFVAPNAQSKGKDVKTKDLLLPTKYTAITDAQKKLDKIAGAEGTPAVVLLEGKLITWDENLTFKRIHAHRRIKILTEAGVEDYGDYRLTLWGDWRIKKTLARTILPDGTIVDAKDNIFEEKSDSGNQEIRIAFPRVQVGAILDIYMEYTSNPWFILPWRLQEDIPVLDSRFILQPPIGLRYRTVVLRLPPETSNPVSVPYGAGRKAFIWRFTDVPALPDLAFLPPTDDISQKLIVITESFKNSNYFLPIAADWESYIKSTSKWWNDWMKSGHSKADALAKQVTGGKNSPTEKAEAIRIAIRERVVYEYFSRGARHDGPDEVLEKGSGTSADVAALVTAMLRAVGVKADLAAIRHRSDGIIPAEIPIPALYNDLLVRIPGNQPIYFSPVADIPVGLLPWDCTGLLAVPFDGKADKPEIIPDLTSQDVRAVRKLDITVADDGSVEGNSTITYYSVAAEEIRNQYRDINDDERKLRFQKRLRSWIDDAVVSTLEFENLQDGTKELVVKSSWEAEGYGTVAGKRMFVNPNLLYRVDASDWAPDNRQYDVNLDNSHATVDEVSITFPDGTKHLEIPGNADLDAGPAGHYKCATTKAGNTVTHKREMTLNMYRFPSDSYPGLKNWFTAIADADDRIIIATQP